MKVMGDFNQVLADNTKHVGFALHDQRTRRLENRNNDHAQAIQATMMGLDMSVLTLLRRGAQAHRWSRSTTMSTRVSYGHGCEDETDGRRPRIDEASDTHDSPEPYHNRGHPRQPTSTTE